jgi:DNA (cytosine-5)-methyltransferase 1
MSLDASVFYNENDDFAADWLENLIEWGEIPYGVVDRRSIVDIKAHELRKYTQCHFFAGVGGWAYALALAGVPTTESIWTGSCPCQPFSVMGLKRGEQDERHLYPAFSGLIEKCKPTTVYGEQVASKDGRAWASRVRTDLERMAYAVGIADLCAAGVTAPHIRQRLYWVGDADYEGLEGHAGNDQSYRGGPRKRGSTSSAGRAVPWETSVRISEFEGRSRRCEPGISPMAYRLPNHMGVLRAYGNAICPQVAEQFIRAHREARG